MNTRSKWPWLLFALFLEFSGIALAQKAQSETFRINGDAGEAVVVQINGHEYVDVRDLARITKGSLSFQKNRTTLTLPAPVSVGPSVNPSVIPVAEEGLSRAFVRAAIEATASMREWGTTLAHLLRNGYPVGEGMVPYHEKALHNLTLASAAASTPVDQSALQLLSNEFQNLSTWSNDVVTARNSASAAAYEISDDALANDSLFQKISQCGGFLGPMLASGNFEDNSACH